MKKILPGLICIGFFFWASVCSGAYLIHLNDGREIITNQYWDEGDQIKLHRYGGVIGIPKDRIVKIEETDEILEEKKTTPIKELPHKDETETTDKEKSQPQSVGQKEAPPPKTENKLLKEFDSLKERFKNVASMSKEQIYQFDKDLTGLRNKILKAGLAGPYANQLTEILTMGSKAEEVLKKRAQ